MEKRRGLMFLTLALAMGTAAAWFTQRLASTPDAQAAVVRTKPVVIVRADVPVATSLTQEHLKTIEWPAEHVPTGAVTSADAAIGRVVRRPVAAGEPLLEMALFATGTAGGLPAVIDAGRRAVSVKVDNVIGVAGFVTPGARVDVMATMRRVDRQKAVPFSKVILQNIRVLAVDQKMEEPRPGEPEVVNVVTLEVAPKEAEHLIYAAHEGRLQLAMRSPGDVEKVETHSATVVDLLGERPVRRQTRRASTAVQIINGSNVQTRRF